MLVDCLNQLLMRLKTCNMPPKKVLCLKDKVKICKDSMKLGFDKEKCMLEFDVKRSCLNKILRDKEKFLKFKDSQSVVQIQWVFFRYMPLDACLKNLTFRVPPILSSISC